MTRKWMVHALLLAFAAGCSADASRPQPEGVSSDAANDANSVAERTAGNVVVAASASPVGEAYDATRGGSCPAGEIVLFSCEVATGKRASLCASRGVSADKGYLYYAFGKPAHPELVFPDAKRPPVDFKRTQLAFAGSTGGYAYSFENQGYRYIVYSVSGADSLEEQGVLVTRGDARNAVSSLPCLKGSVREDDDAALLDLTFTWPVDPDLDRHGLPTRK